MTFDRSLPCAVSIAGLDPSGGAGIAADLRGFAAAGVWGCAACAVLTVQSTAGLRSVLPTPADNLRAQIDELFAHQRVAAIKTGALGSTTNVHVALEASRRRPDAPLVVDPVIVATRSPEGARLLDDEALEAMRELCAAAVVVTPNIDEAEALLACSIRDLPDQIEAARALVSAGPRAALVKGGHLDGPHAIDVLAFRDRVVELSSPRIATPPFHGGGCLLAALVGGHLARHGYRGDLDVEAAARFAQATLHRAIASASQIGDGLLVLPVA